LLLSAREATPGGRGCVSFVSFITFAALEDVDGGVALALCGSATRDDSFG
jgi:hypothetical protein